MSNASINAMGKESEAEAAASDRRWITSEDHAANRGSVVPVLETAPDNNTPPHFTPAMGWITRVGLAASAGCLRLGDRLYDTRVLGRGDAVAETGELSCQPP